MDKKVNITLPSLKEVKEKEIEIKVEVENSKPLQEFLEREATFKYEAHQKDEYFNPSHRDFIAADPIEEWLRVRTAGTKKTINYKKWHYNQEGKSYQADEYETPIEDVEIMKKIFAALNIKPLIIVEKIRKTWQYNDYEIALDSVKGLGDFVEIEYTGSASVDPEQKSKEMIAFLKDKQCGKIRVNYRGYPHIFLLGRKTEDIN